MAVIAISSSGGGRHGDVLADPEVAKGQTDADELGDDREEVKDEQVADREPAPEAPEALIDQARVPNSGHGAEADHHLLVDDQHWDQQEQDPQQTGAEVLACLGVGGDAASVVVADHHDQPWPHDRQQRQQAGPPAIAVRVVAHPDRPKGAVDVAAIGRIEDRRSAHLLAPLVALVLDLVHHPPFLAAGNHRACPSNQQPGGGARGTHSRAPKV